ncbi:MAG TPA: OB-fold domain-containing protein, partial [Methanomicrobiales archaeon]|nr:OB-fold domain-containing protein [Methanomicrobiales archaeon]
VVTHTVIRSASEQFENTTPYVLAIIELDEGPRLTAQVVAKPEEVAVGTRVRPVFRRIMADGESGVIHYGTKFVPVK